MTRKHGHYTGDKPSPEYYSWRSIKARCFNQNHHSFHKYGGSGVIMHPEWANDFSSFFRDVGIRPSLKHTLDRKDSALGYIPGNVRWATSHTQNRNRSDNHWITVGEETLCLEDWARKLGCSPHAIRTRVKRGWSWERAVTEPPNPKLQSKNHPRVERSEEISLVLKNGSILVLRNGEVIGKNNDIGKMKKLNTFIRSLL